MEVIIQPSPAEVGRLAARKVALDHHPEAGRGARPGDRVLAARHLRRTGPSGAGRYPRPAPDPRASPSTSTSASPRTIRSRTRRCCAASSVEPLGLDPSQVALPDGRAADLAAACEAYEAAIRDAGGVDLQILGIGANGHIGFNEPTSSFASRTRLKTLALQTRADNARFFDESGRGPDALRHPGARHDHGRAGAAARGSGRREGRGGRRRPSRGRCRRSVPPRSCSSTSTPRSSSTRMRPAGSPSADYYRHTYAHKPSWQRF